MTQNFKAEYEKSSSAIITAVTKSGANDFHADGFAQYQDKSLVADDDCANTVNGRCGTAHNPNHEKPDYTRWQAGVSLGGPIMKDTLHFFGSWEYNDQNRANNVAVGSQINLVPAAAARRSPRPTGEHHEPVPVPPRVRQDLLAGVGLRRRGHERLLPEGERDPRLRRPDELRERQQHRKRRLERAGQEHLGPDHLYLGDDRLLQRLPVESPARQSRPDRPELRAGPPHRRREQPPGLQPETVHAARGLQLHGPPGAGKPRLQGGRVLQLERLQRPQVPERQPGIRLHLFDQPGFQLPLPGVLRLRQSRHLRAQQPVRRLRPG